MLVPHADAVFGVFDFVSFLQFGRFRYWKLFRVGPISPLDNVVFVTCETFQSVDYPLVHYVEKIFQGDHARGG